MRLLLVFVACLALSAEAQSVEQRLRQAQDMLRQAQIPQARGVLEGAAALCDSSTDGACAETYAWLGMVMERDDEDNVGALRDRIEPLYAKALARAGGSPPALLLELDGHALVRTGQAGPGGALLGRAAELRRNNVASLSPSSSTPDPARKTGGGTSRPQLLTRVEPSYSDPARLRRQQGTVILKLVVDTDGRAVDIRLARSLGFELDEQAVRAVLSWKFSPGVSDGQPVKAEAMIEVNFRLL